MAALLIIAAPALFCAASAAAAPAPKPIIVTGQIAPCLKLKHPLVQLKARIPLTNKHLSAIVPAAGDGHFKVQGTRDDLPNGRYEILVGEDADNLDGQGTVDIRGSSVDAGIVGDCDTGND